MYRQQPVTLGHRERADIEARRDVAGVVPPRMASLTSSLAQQLRPAAVAAPNQQTTVQLRNVFAKTNLETITGSNMAVFVLVAAIEKGLRPQQHLPATVGEAITTAHQHLQIAGKLAPPEVMQRIMSDSPTAPGNFTPFEEPDTSIVDPLSLTRPLWILRQATSHQGLVPSAYALACVTERVDGSHTVKVRFTHSGRPVIGTVLLYRQLRQLPDLDMKLEMWRAFVSDPRDKVGNATEICHKARLTFSQATDALSSAAPLHPSSTSKVPNVQTEQRQGEQQGAGDDSDDEVEPTPTKRKGRKLAPVIPNGHRITSDFNNYGNLTEAELLFGKDAGGKFLVPSHHMFGGIFLKIFQTYSHAEIVKWVNLKRKAEGFGEIDRKSCERRLTAAVNGKEVSDAARENRDPDFLKALVDHDVSQGKDRAKSLAQRSQKVQDGKTSSYGTYGTPKKDTKKRKPAQGALEENTEEEMRPKKVARTQVPSLQGSTPAMPTAVEENQNESGLGIPEINQAQYAQLGVGNSAQNDDTAPPAPVDAVENPADVDTGEWQLDPEAFATFDFDAYINAYDAYE